MHDSFFVTDLHGHPDRYRKLFAGIREEMPQYVFFGGDLLPHRLRLVENFEDFALDFLFPELGKLKSDLGDDYPEIFLILGNDDPKSEEWKFIEAAEKGLFTYANVKKAVARQITVYGYSFVPPTPFQLKDWEKYDVSRYVDPGCIHPTEGFRTLDPLEDIEYATISKDLEKLTLNEDLSSAVMLFHSPPYKSQLDRAALDGVKVEHVPLDVHVGSIAIQRFIRERQPLCTLHGHIHESTRITGQWKETTGRTISFNAAHDGPELCIVKFNSIHPEDAVRLLL